MWLEEKPSRRNFETVLKLLGEAEVTQQGKPSKLDTRMKFLQENNPLGANHPAVKQYNKCMRGAGDTVRSIIISANSRLAFLENKQVLRLLSKDDLNLPEIGIGVNGDGETKTALFCVIPDSDKSYNFIIGMLYTQIFQELYYQADFNCGGRLPIHVTFMLDEFANVALPDDYILDEIAKFVAVPHNSCRSFSGTAAVRPSLNICRRADDICFRIFRKINNYAYRRISAQCSKKFIIKVYSLPYKVVFQIIILGNFPVLTRCDPCSFFEYLHKAYLIFVSAEVGYFLNGHIGGRKIILSCLDLCG